MASENNLAAGEQEIKDLIDAKIRAIYERDIEGLLSNYPPDVVTFDLMSPLQNNTRDAIKKRLESWFAGYESPISQEIACLEIAVSGDVAFSHCLTRTYGTNAKGEDMDMWYRTTNGYRKTGGNRWFITHEHNSEPIHMETGMAMFDLKPEFKS
jgi:uncharacterized protein (TIGR02246 family)